MQLDDATITPLADHVTAPLAVLDASQLTSCAEVAADLDRLLAASGLAWKDISLALGAGVAASPVTQRVPPRQSLWERADRTACQIGTTMHQSLSSSSSSALSGNFSKLQ
jgi:hypothetical protein